MKRRTVFLVAACLFCVQALWAQVISGTYALKNRQTGLVLRIKDANTSNGTPLVLYTPQNWKCVTWKFEHLDGQVYQLKNLYSGKTFQPESAKTENNTGLAEQPLVDKQANQQYEFIPVEKNLYFIRLNGTDLYLTPSGDGAVNTQIILAKKNGSKNQQWSLHEQDPAF